MFFVQIVNGLVSFSGHEINAFNTRAAGDACAHVCGLWGQTKDLGNEPGVGERKEKCFEQTNEILMEMLQGKGTHTTR